MKPRCHRVSLLMFLLHARPTAEGQRPSPRPPLLDLPPPPPPPPPTPNSLSPGPAALTKRVTQHTHTSTHTNTSMRTGLSKSGIHKLTCVSQHTPQHTRACARAHTHTSAAATTTTVIHTHTNTHTQTQDTHKGGTLRVLRRPDTNAKAPWFIGFGCATRAFRFKNAPGVRVCERECVVYWYSFSSSRTWCIHCGSVYASGGVI